MKWPLMPCAGARRTREDRKSTRLNSSHLVISYAVFCLKKEKTRHPDTPALAHHRQRRELRRDSAHLLPPQRNRDLGDHILLHYRLLSSHPLTRRAALPH